VILGVPTLVVEQVPFLGSVFLTESLSTTPPTHSQEPIRGRQPRDGEGKGQKKYEVHFRMETPFEPGPAGMAQCLEDLIHYSVYLEYRVPDDGQCSGTE